LHLLLHTIKQHHFTTYPITQDPHKHHLKPFINLKHFLTQYPSPKPIRIPSYIHQLPIISHTTGITDALVTIQTRHVHITFI
ncbi:CBS domain-containing protein, partial [Staphylococcus epidermidis]